MKDITESPSVNILKKFLLITNENEPDLIIDLLFPLGTTLPEFPKYQIINAVSRVFSGIDAISEKDKNMFPQLALLLNASNFNDTCNNPRVNTFDLSESLKALLSFEDEGKGKFLPIEEKALSTSVIALHDNGYFSRASHFLISNLLPKLEPKKSHAITGLLLGASLNNNKLMRNSLLEILQDKDIKSDILEGVISVMLGDIEADKSIRTLAKQLDIDGSLLINIMDISAAESKNFSTIIIEMLNRNPTKDENKLCNSFISLFKGDMSSFNMVAAKIGVNLNSGTPVIAAALGNMTIISEYYS